VRLDSANLDVRAMLAFTWPTHEHGEDHGDRWQTRIRARSCAARRRLGQHGLCLGRLDHRKWTHGEATACAAAALLRSISTTAAAESVHHASHGNQRVIADHVSAV